MKTCALLLTVALAPSLLVGSGSYSLRPPRPPTAVERTRDADKERYELGKNIYTGKARLSAQPSMGTMKTQEARLKALQSRLPDSAQKKTNLPALAGRLTSGEMDALEYYVNKRFPNK